MAETSTAFGSKFAAPAREQNPGPTGGINVGPMERWASLAGGAALVGYGLTRNSLGGTLLALLGGALAYRGLAGHCPGYQALGITTAEGRHGPATSVPAGHGCKIETRIAIQHPPAEVFRFWRNLENLPRVFQHLQEVKNLGNKRSHWVARGPLGKPVSWDAEIINERENELIAWGSLPNSEVATAGSVHFQPTLDGRATLVQVTLKYEPPAGALGGTIAKFLGADPQQEIEEDLRRFKQLMESGEASRTQPQGQSWGDFPQRQTTYPG